MCLLVLGFYCVPAMAEGIKDTLSTFKETVAAIESVNKESNKVEPPVAPPATPIPPAPPPAPWSDEVNARLQDMEKRLQAAEALKGRLEAVEAQERISYENQVMTQEKLYKGAATVLVGIIQDSSKLAIIPKVANMTAAFETNTNPLAVQSFRDLVTRYTGGGDLTGPNNGRIGLADLGGTLLTNPFTSLAYSVVSLFMSRRPRAEDKPGTLQQVVAIVNVDTKAYNDLIVLQKQYDRVIEQLESLGIDAKSLFKTYAGTVGYTKDYEAYDKDDNAINDLNHQIENFFAKQVALKPEPGRTPEGVQNAHYSLRLLSAMVTRYSTQLKEVDGVMKNFGDAIRARAADMSAIPAMAGQATALTALATDADSIRTEIQKDYEGPIGKWENLLLRY